MKWHYSGIEFTVDLIINIDELFPWCIISIHGNQVRFHEAGEISLRDAVKQYGKETKVPPNGFLGRTANRRFWCSN